MYVTTKNMRTKSFYLLLTVIITALLSACATSSIQEKRNIITAQNINESTMGRADPGYMQYLERLSMLYHAGRLGPLVSGTNMHWRADFTTPGSPLVNSGQDVWLHIHPQTVLSSTDSTPLRQLSSPLFWAALQRLGVKGIYISPTGGSGNQWSHERRLDLGSNEDIIQFTFAKTVGSEDDYARIIKQATAQKCLLGGDIISAAPGLGPDFFLATRNMRNYPGIFNLIEVPKDFWPYLPDMTGKNEEWQVEELTRAQVQALAAKGFITPYFKQENLPYLTHSGWAATGAVLGIDGNSRRWIYRFAHSAKRPVLNIYDPAHTAAQIFSGSAIYQLGILGNSLAGMELAAFFGLEGTHSVATSISEPGNYTAALSMAAGISRQSRSYHGLSWLKDSLPLPLLKQFMLSGPDMVKDCISSPAAEHALLSGNTALLKFMLDEAVQNEIDFTRLIHLSSGYSGIDYTLPHLRYLEAGSDSVNLFGPDERSMQAKDFISATLFELRQKAEQPLENPENSLIQNNTLYTTPAGLAALALGIQHTGPVSSEDIGQVRRGHMLLQFFKAMQPGVWMLDGQDVSGTMPIQPAMLSADNSWKKNLATMGTYPLLASSDSFLISSLGIPKAKSLYGPFDTQATNPYSALTELAELIRLRNTTGISRGEFIGYLPAKGAGVVAMVTRLPNTQESGETYLIAISNFGREQSEEIIDISTLPALEVIANNAEATMLYGDTGHVSKYNERILFIAPPWSKALVQLRVDQQIEFEVVDFDAESEQVNEPQEGNSSEFTELPEFEEYLKKAE